MRHGTQQGYKDGCRCSECKSVKSAADKIQYRRNREKRLAYAAARRAADPEGVRQYKRDLYAGNADYRARIVERSKQWRAEHPERQAELGRAWAEANPDRTRKSKREWEQRNPNAVRENVRRARARRRDALIVKFTAAQLEQRLSMFDGCWMCGDPATEVDHVKPLSKGGAHCLANLRPTCLPCNRRKSARWPLSA